MCDFYPEPGGYLSVTGHDEYLPDGTELPVSRFYSNGFVTGCYIDTACTETAWSSMQEARAVRAWRWEE